MVASARPAASASSPAVCASMSPSGRCRRVCSEARPSPGLSRGTGQVPRPASSRIRTRTASRNGPSPKRSRTCRNRARPRCSRSPSRLNRRNAPITSGTTSPRPRASSTTMPVPGFAPSDPPRTAVNVPSDWAISPTSLIHGRAHARGQPETLTLNFLGRARIHGSDSALVRIASATPLTFIVPGQTPQPGHRVTFRSESPHAPTEVRPAACTLACTAGASSILRPCSSMSCRVVTCRGQPGV